MFKWLYDIKEIIFAVVLILLVGLFIALCVYGYANNIAILAGIKTIVFSGEILLRVVGIVLPFIGIVMGFV